MQVRALLLPAVALSLTLGAVSASAQGAVEVGPHPVFGAMAGVNFAKLGGDDAEGAGTRTAFMGGVFMDLRMGTGNGLYFHPELLYSQKGATDADGGNGTLRLDYVEVPVLVRYEIPTQGNVRPYVSLGPSFAFQTKCELKGEVNGGDVTADCDAAQIDNKSFDIGALGDVGVQFRAGRQLISVGGRYTYGFSDVAKDFDAKNRAFALYAGVAF